TRAPTARAAAAAFAAAPHPAPVSEPVSEPRASPTCCPAAADAPCTDATDATGAHVPACPTPAARGPAPSVAAGAFTLITPTAGGAAADETDHAGTPAGGGARGA